MLFVATFLVWLVHQFSITSTLDEAAKSWTKSHLGNAIEIKGPTKLTFSVRLEPTLIFNDVVLKNVSWSNSPERLTAQRVKLKLSLLPLLIGKISLNAISIEDSEIWVEQNVEQIHNWQIQNNKKNTLISDMIKQFPNLNAINTTIHLFNNRSTVKINHLKFKNTLVLDDKYLYFDGVVNNQPLSINTDVKILGNTVNFNDLKLFVFNNQLTGNLHISQNQRFLVDGTLKSKLFTISPSQSSLETMLSTNIAWQLFKNIDFNIQIKSKRIRWQHLFTGTSKIDFQVHHGQLTAQFLKTQFMDGTLEISFNANTTLAEPRLAIHVNAKDNTLAKLIPNEDAITQGKLKLKWHTQHTGNTLGDLLNTTHGKIVAEGNDITLKGISEITSNGFISNLMQNLFKKSEPNKKTVFECLVINLPFEEGTARVDKRLAAELENTTLVGYGLINLPKWTIDLKIKPDVKSGVNLNIVDFANLVTIKGPIQTPNVQVDPKGLFTEGASIAAGIATGGISTIAKVFTDTVMRDDTPCKTALEN